MKPITLREVLRNLWTGVAVKSAPRRTLSENPPATVDDRTAKMVPLNCHLEQRREEDHAIAYLLANRLIPIEEVPAVRRALRTMKRLG